MRKTAILALVACPLVAQDPAPEPDEGATVLLSQAMRTLVNATETVVKANVKHETKPPPGMGGVGAVVVLRQGGPGAAPFEGDVEAWRAADGAVVVTSTEALPGFALHVKEGRAVKEVTYEDEAPDLEQLRAELATLLDAPRLARHVLDANLAPSRAETGALTFRGKVDRGVVRPMKEGMMVKRVVGAEAEVVLDAAGALKEAKIRIAHADPVQQMLRGEMKGVRIAIQGAGGPAAPLPADDETEDEEGHDVETGSTTYTLTFEARPPSERAKAFKKKVEELLAR